MPNKHFVFKFVFTFNCAFRDTRYNSKVKGLWWWSSWKVTGSSHGMGHCHRTAEDHTHENCCPCARAHNGRILNTCHVSTFNILELARQHPFNIGTSCNVCSDTLSKRVLLSKCLLPDWLMCAFEILIFWVFLFLSVYSLCLDRLKHLWECNF